MVVQTSKERLVQTMPQTGTHNLLVSNGRPKEVAVFTTTSFAVAFDGGSKMSVKGD